MTDLSKHLDIHDLVADLTQTHRHREPYAVREGQTTWTRGHVTTVPSLIVQLGQVTAANTGEGGVGGYSSRPVAPLESIDTLIHIDLAASRWVRDLGEDDPQDTEGCIRRLHALHASASSCNQTKPKRDQVTREVTCCSQHAIEADVRTWWTQARVVTGWDSPAWRPDNTCPMCDKRGTLRVRLSAHSGICIDCRETWDDTTIGLLAEHIRSENYEDAEQQQHADDSHGA